MRILLDGWSLIYSPGSPAALHLATILRTIPLSIQAVLALPGNDPGIEELPDSVEILSRETRKTVWGTMVWQQTVLPRLSIQTRADLILTAAESASLLGRAATVACPAGWHLGSLGAESGLRGKRGFGSHLLEALGFGGLNRAQAVFWPADLPSPSIKLPVEYVPPLVHPVFQSRQPTPAIEFWSGVDLPETYVLYHGPLDTISVSRLLHAWSWAAPSIASYYPLLVYGGSETEQHAVLEAARRYKLGDSLLLLPPASSVQLAALYYGCSALFQPGSISPWGDPLRHALACAKPVVSTDNHWSDALVGRAGFLVPADDLRGLGAALITVIVEDDLAERLSDEAKQRAKNWSAEGFWQALLKYQV